ncbi:ThuA domain-containing protein [Chitinophaga alhagiae]|uniref:ThuA domain-containing protein n=1 Tax=Chitinophaga alhagiae TaxID=2203219 RepID=UPI000E5C0792|nr:ThuA domain-containing protein [Chitinophaga alhagiae]
MKTRTILLLAFGIFWGLFGTGCTQKRPGMPHVLVFTKTAGFHHGAIADGVKAIEQLGRQHHFTVDTTSNAARFTEDTLKQYAAVIFLNTTGDVLDAGQQADFERYIQAGGGYVGVHAASDCEYHWPWYGKLVGAYFKGHPRTQEARLNIHRDSKFPVTDSLPDPWTRTDEWYNFREIPENVQVLVSIDEGSYEGGKNGADHPMVWYHEYDGGRAFYNALGHTPASYTEPAFLQLLHAGIRYAIGENAVLDYGKATTLRKPDDARFSKKFLAGGLYEPTELTVLPDRNILIAERRGTIKFFDQASQAIREVAQLDVYHSGLNPGGSTEGGLLGMQADPQYEKNHWIYVYYSPTGAKPVDRLSRFRFENGRFDLPSEQVILEVTTDREICCHTGGSIAFDASGHLYLSVGDNTTPFNEVDKATRKAYDVNLYGFAPLDDRPGFENYDNGRAAGNSNDLRGKILRIRVNEDGTYSIPDGNLFPKGTPQTRPEIYVMGNRNPYRIAVDKHSGYLYWGEVGPDAGNDSLSTRGPRGYDEINQARKAGNFGWPYFVGNNYAYFQYDYATGVSGPVFNADGPVNHSRNNTGIKQLPPAQPAFIWYPYAVSQDFPVLGTGGRTAMAGPVYHVKDYPEATRYPRYYDGKLFIYDWMRNWIMAVTMTKEGNLQTIEKFMPHVRFSNISDMEAGPDGQLYIVEYGGQWRHKNADAGLSVITYNGGNLAPAVQLAADTSAGALPLTVRFSAAGTVDPDGDPLAYTWNFGDGEPLQTAVPEASHTFTKAGTYPVSVEVTDGKGGKTKGPLVHVYAGNAVPRVKISVAGNPSFYFPDRPLSYEVEVNDAEDGRSGQPGFDAAGVMVRADYISKPDKALLLENGAPKTGVAFSGKRLMESLDCKSCHQVDAVSVGPAFKQVALRYKDDKRAVNFLPHKIINGSSGNWGQVAMAAHPDLSVPDAQKIVSWILSLAGSSGNTMPLKGSILPARQFQLVPRGAIALSAAYTDKGAEGILPLTGNAVLVLRDPTLPARSADASSADAANSKLGNMMVVHLKNRGWLKFSGISLENVKGIQIKYSTDQLSDKGWKVSLRLGSPQGQLLGTAVIGRGIADRREAYAVLPLSQAPDSARHDVYFVFQKEDPEETGGLGIAEFTIKTK